MEKSGVQETEFKEARWYKKLENQTVQCQLCNRECKIAPNKTGICRVRKNIDGTLYALTYGRTLTMSIDPVEKKPLFHFKPGTLCTGVSTFGCNFRCTFCQNWQISQDFMESQIAAVPYTFPEEIVLQTKTQGIPGIAYTYTEPTIFAEYALDTMKLAKEQGLYNVWISNGYTTQNALKDIIPYMDAVNVDLKGNEKFYRKMCGNIDRKKIIQNIEYYFKKGVHLEVTNLVVPGSNDSDNDFREISEFISSLNPDIPLHFSRFFPHWKMQDTPPTPISSLARARKIAEEAGLNYVYIGNVSGEENTHCKKCKTLLVKRFLYQTSMPALEGNNCKKCGTKNNFIP